MKTLQNILNLVCDLLRSNHSPDRVSLHMVQFSLDAKTVVEQQRDWVPFIPREYLNLQVHDIADDTWNYIAEASRGLDHLPSAARVALLP